MNELSYKLESKKSVDQLATDLEAKSVEKQFRVLAVHDMQDNLAKKGFSREPLKIVEVCDSGFAYEALKKSIDVSLFMPCKFIIYKENDKTIINLARPTMISKVLPDSQFEELAEDIENRLKDIMNQVV